MRTVVVGASSGLGRFIGVGLGRRGDQVALLARRADRLREAAADAGPDAVIVECDVTDETSARAAVAKAAAALGGIDAVIYTAGIGPLSRLVDLDAETWRSVLDTNVVGASIVTAAAMPFLTETNGTVVYLSSVSGSLTAPWPGLGAYGVSKAALERLIDAWRGEHPDVGFTRVVVGETLGGDLEHMTEFANSWSPELAGEVGAGWVQRGLMSGGLVDAVDILGAVAHAIDCGTTARIPHITVVPRPPAAS